MILRGVAQVLTLLAFELTSPFTPPHVMHRYVLHVIALIVLVEMLRPWRQRMEAQS